MRPVPAAAFFLALLLLPLAAPASTDADAAFTALHEAEYAWRSGKAAGPADLELPDNARLDTVDARSQAQRLAYWERVHAALEAIDPAALTRANRDNYAVYRRQITNLIADQRFRAWEMPFNSDSSFWADIHWRLADGGLKTVADYRRYIERLGQVPRYFAQQIENMRAGLERGFSVPRAVLDGRDASIAAEADLEDAAQSAFFKPLRELPPGITEAEAAPLRAAALRVISTQVRPAYRELLRFFREEYLPGARRTLAAEALPGGKAYYRQQVRAYTTLDLDPDAIHAIGLREMARIRAQMEAVKTEAGFDGDLAAFIHFLRTDAQFYARTPEELLARSAWVAKQVDGKIGAWFGHLPRSRFTIVAVPDAIAPFYTSGRGGARAYLVNTWDLRSRALYNMPALTLHESYPGHSLQLALAEEGSSHPAFRRESYISAYGEGWGLYAEYLGQEMGIYDDPYKRFGFLTYQAWRAARLVIDTGIHHLGWSRQQALDYLDANTALSKLEIANEIDRYISWPGQALSYALGYLEILRLREHAAAALGERFDLRAFHDTVLATGSVPLPVLAARIERFIAAGGPEPDYLCDNPAPAQ